MEARADVVRRSIRLAGVVQGVGFRPFVHRLASELGLAGWVLNGPQGVEIEAEGAAERIDEFVRRMLDDGPPGAVVSSHEISAVAPRGESRFAILESCVIGVRKPALAADLAACEACIAEINDPASRRFRYPFTTCAACGPRYSIVEDLPYDRRFMSMRQFAMCRECAREYNDPSDRRFHAETIACPMCGPKLSVIDAMNRELASGDSALHAAAEAIRRGQIVALMGIGGFQLIVDALNESAVGRLRERKRRPDKPFALMFSSLELVREYCALSANVERALTSEAAPIVLLDRLERPAPNRPALAGKVAPGNPRLGAMLPYSPLHSLLLAEIDRPVVCTSGNLSNEPICIETEEAIDRLTNIADIFLTHDRAVVRPIDDSVVSGNAIGIRMIRRARGYAPVAIDLGSGGPSVLALGSHLKNTVALAVGREVVMSQHIGDLGSAPARTAFRRTLDDLRSFLPCRIDLLACDLHPDYASTIVAEQLAAELCAPLVRVQHHHAHIAAVAAEHGLEEPVLGFAWDGSGYGLDGTIWGGEAIVVRGAGFERVATMRSFRLPGGESAVREPRRSALGALHSAGLEPPASVLGWFEGEMAERLLGILDRGHVPVTSSIGRLFDAVAALCGLRGIATFEGQAAMDLEYALDASADREGAYPVMVQREDELLVGDWKPLLEAVLADLRTGVAITRISARFHNALANFALEIARAAGLARIATGGGCFQNEYLLHRVTTRLESAGFQLFAPARIPINDGGISFGQVAAARRAARESEDVPGRSR